MKVSELMKALESMNPDAEIRILYDSGFGEADLHSAYRAEDYKQSDPYYNPTDTERLTDLNHLSGRVILRTDQ